MELSPRVFSVGGRLGYVDDGATPNTLIVFTTTRRRRSSSKCAACPPAGRSKDMDKYRGSVDMWWIARAAPWPGLPRHTDGQEIKKFTGSSSHFANFIDAVRSRKPRPERRHSGRSPFQRPLPHRQHLLPAGQEGETGRDLDALKSDRHAAETLDRFQAHLAANGVDLEVTEATLGVLSTMAIRRPSASSATTRQMSS